MFTLFVKRSVYAAALAVVCVLGVGAAVADAPAPLPPSPQLTADRANFLQIAEDGVRKINRYWWNSRTRWYNDQLKQPQDGKAPIWTTVHLFSTLNGIVTADRTPANVRQLKWFADRTFREYWNPQVGHVRHTRRHVGGFDPSTREAKTPRAHAFYDDNGWLGLAFLEAYRITKTPRYLRYADDAFQFIAQTGWADGAGGGIWWDTGHASRSSESISSATLLAAMLYQATHKRSYLGSAQKYIAWANSHIWDAENGLYMRDLDSPILMGYVQSPMMVAYATLCQTTKNDGLCDKAEQLGGSALAHFTENLTHGPQYDAVYLHWMLTLYGFDHDARWYSLAYDNAQRALAKARNSAGLFLKAWDGSRAPDAPPDALKIDAATLSVFAWLAAATPPPSTP